MRVLKSVLVKYLSIGPCFKSLVFSQVALKSLIFANLKRTPRCRIQALDLIGLKQWV
jgi:hypothetical protein